MLYDRGVSLKFITKEISEGNSRAFDYVFNEFYVYLCRFSFTFIKDQSMAEGVVQEVFIKLWEKREALFNVENLLSYMMTMVRNHSIDHIRKEKAGLKAQQKILTEESANTTEDQLSENELEDKLLQAIHKLPERCKIAFELSRFEGLSNKDIAVKMEISVKGVEALIGRSLKLLRSELIEFLPLQADPKQKGKTLLLFMLLNNSD
ncbi:MAG: RNA polymerase sigma-70 factor [Prolixibacteraceae bacterium]|nr:RNA polymerase sigma-70 factor [Prolixibacteraceae bacterium]